MSIAYVDTHIPFFTGSDRPQQGGSQVGVFHGQADWLLAREVDVCFCCYLMGFGYESFRFENWRQADLQTHVVPVETFLMGVKLFREYSRVSLVDVKPVFVSSLKAWKFELLIQ